MTDKKVSSSSRYQASSEVKKKADIRRRFCSLQNFLTFFHIFIRFFYFKNIVFNRKFKDTNI